tara:strand:+ start:335 stop:649 length:315 start_codon:yes stop_codon:yes gene_type:complete
MLAKEQKLSREEFSTLFHDGKRIHSDAFSFIYRKKTAPLPKAGVVISKKVIPGVITRNLVKRRLYNVIKNNHQYDTILLAKKGIQEKSFAELTDAYETLLKKTK